MKLLLTEDDPQLGEALQVRVPRHDGQDSGMMADSIPE
jgi:hypothetical protein